MKTLESILKTISIESNKCDNCGVCEGIEHPIKGLSVSLKTLSDAQNKKKYCQVCWIQKSKKSKTQKKKDMLLLVKRFSFCIILICFMISISSIAVTAQPGLPGDPAQAPIDGGLGLLAAVGGAYAIKKLRAKDKEE